MEKMTVGTLVVLAILVGTLLPARSMQIGSESVTIEEAMTVANNWISLIIDIEGDWGGSETAEVAEIDDFKRGDRVIGYFCRIDPHGYIIVSLQKVLGPVKAYSTTTILDPESDDDLVDLLKRKMERILDTIEPLLDQTDPEKVQHLSDILEIDYRQSWANLGIDTETMKGNFLPERIRSNYQGGDPPLLTSHWRQDWPYNIRCPSPPSGSDCTDNHCLAGCGAVMTAQVLRYWGYPRLGGWPEYRNMPDNLDTGDPTQEQIQAVAEFISNVGESLDQMWCSDSCMTGSYFSGCVFCTDIIGTFKASFYYSEDADVESRNNNSAQQWFNKIKNQLNQNRPIPYSVVRHDIVCDGWKIVGSNRYYHMNYGGGNIGTCQNGCDTWYLLDGLYWGNFDKEEMIINLYPEGALGNSISGLYLDPSPDILSYYFDQDCWGNAVFEPGQAIQFLPGIVLKCSGGIIQFGSNNYSSPATRLFSRGDRGRGIIMNGGVMQLYQNGSIKFH